MFRKYEYRGVIFGCALFNIYTWKLAVKHCLLILAQLLKKQKFNSCQASHTHSKR